MRRRRWDVGSEFMGREEREGEGLDCFVRVVNVWKLCTRDALSVTENG